MSSVLKFAIDLYSIEGTSQLIYTNDVKVLIDIIIRQLNDLSDTDKVFMDVWAVRFSWYFYGMEE